MNVRRDSVPQDGFGFRALRAFRFKWTQSLSKQRFDA